MTLPQSTLHALVAAPVLLPMATALLTLALARHRRWQRRTSLAGALLLLLAGCALVGLAGQSVPLSSRFGDWPAPFAIAFHIDRLSAAMIAVSALVLLAALLYPERGGGRPSPLRAPLVHGLMIGVGGAFATDDLFNLYVWFEIMLVAALGLLALGRTRASLEAAFKYLGLNLLGTVLLLVAVGGLYGLTGALNYGALGEALDARGGEPATVALMALLLVALLIKAGAFPFYFWLPAAYPTLPAALLALFAGLLTKVGAYAVLRLGADVGGPAMAPLLAPLGWLAVATMLAGVLGAAYHWDTRRILSFHIVSQIGYILLAISLGTLAGYAAALFYTVHHIVVKANLFLLAGLMRRRSGGHDLRDEAGAAGQGGALPALFAIPAASLVGVPLLSGFWAKLLVIAACFEAGMHLWGGLALLTGVLTLFSMSKVWIEAFWRPSTADSTAAGRPLPRMALLSCGMLAAVTLAVGLHPEPLIDYAHAAFDAPQTGGGG